jgi:hypothetical protein
MDTLAFFLWADPLFLSSTLLLALPFPAGARPATAIITSRWTVAFHLVNNMQSSLKKKTKHRTVLV